HRDRELMVVDLESTPPQVAGRIQVGGQPGKMILNRAQTRLFVANSSTDTVSVVDTMTDTVIEEIATVAPRALIRNRIGLKGANPNGLALAPDERILYVTNGGTNSVAVIRLAGPRGADDQGDELAGDDGGDADSARRPSRVIGLIPTGWYPTSVSVSADGSRLYVTNGK